MSIFYDANQRTFTLSGGDVSYVLHIDDCGRVMNLPACFICRANRSAIACIWTTRWAL